MLPSVLATDHIALLALIRIKSVWDLENNSISNVVTPGKCQQQEEINLGWITADFVVHLAWTL